MLGRIGFWVWILCGNYCYNLARSEICVWVLQPVSVLKFPTPFSSLWLIFFDPLGFNVNC
jgi:hypothetical protein